jgi:hypothetical protein
MVLYIFDGQPISLELLDVTKPQIDFTDTSISMTSQSCHLPAPAQVRALSKDIGTNPHPAPIKFEDLSLIVKFGPHVTTVEAQNPRVIKKGFKARFQCLSSLAGGLMIKAMCSYIWS